MNRDELIEVMARADAAFDGRPMEAMPAADRKRYVARSTAALTAIEAAGMRVLPSDALQAQAAEIEQLREIAKSYKGDAIDTLAKLREAVAVLRDEAEALERDIPWAETSDLGDLIARRDRISAFLATMEKPHE